MQRPEQKNNEMRHLTIRSLSLFSIIITIVFLSGSRSTAFLASLLWDYYQSSGDTAYLEMLQRAVKDVRAATKQAGPSQAA